MTFHIWRLFSCPWNSVRERRREKLQEQQTDREKAKTQGSPKFFQGDTEKIRETNRLRTIHRMVGIVEWEITEYK